MIARATETKLASWGHRTLPWLDSFVTGDDRIDDEHRALVDLCNNLCALADRGVTAAQARAAACELLACIEAHFASEEALFPQIRFPHHRDHLREHESIRQIVGTLLLGKPDDFVIAAATTRVVLIEHILRHDLGFKTFVQEARG